jgi:hypothetical protein
VLLNWIARAAKNSEPAGLGEDHLNGPLGEAQPDGVSTPERGNEVEPVRCPAGFQDRPIAEVGWRLAHAHFTCRGVDNDRIEQLNIADRLFSNQPAPSGSTPSRMRQRNSLVVVAGLADRPNNIATERSFVFNIACLALAIGAAIRRTPRNAAPPM